VKILFENFKKYLSKRFNVPINEIVKDMSFTDDLGIDSLTLYSLIEDVEKEFNIKLDIEDIISINSVGKIYEYISKKFND